MNLTAHQFSFYTYSVSEAWFKGLPADLQQVVVQAGKTAGEYHSGLQEQMEKDFRTTLEKKGMKFVDSDRKAFQEILADIPNQFESQWVPGLYKKIQEAKAKLK